MVLREVRIEKPFSLCMQAFMPCGGRFVAIGHHFGPLQGRSSAFAGRAVNGVDRTESITPQVSRWVDDAQSAACSSIYLTLSGCARGMPRLSTGHVDDQQWLARHRRSARWPAIVGGHHARLVGAGALKPDLVATTGKG
jgi:hypothetical protein